MLMALQLLLRSLFRGRLAAFDLFSVVPAARALSCIASRLRRSST